MPIFFSRSPICGPPPCTITGFMPTSFSITTSRAKPALRCASVIALPPYLTTIVRSWKRRMYGSASARICALTAALTASIGMASGGGAVGDGAGDCTRTPIARPHAARSPAE